MQSVMPSADRAISHHRLRFIIPEGGTVVVVVDVLRYRHHSCGVGMSHHRLTVDVVD